MAPSNKYIEKYLSFTPTEVPKWRDGAANVPTIPQMVEAIFDFNQKHLKLKAECKIDHELRDKKSKVRRDLLVKYLLNVQKEEEIGINDGVKTEEIMDQIDQLSLSGHGDSAHPEETACSSRHYSPVRNESPDFETFPSVENDLPDIYDSVLINDGFLQKNVTEIQNLYRAYKHIIHELATAKKKCDSKGDFKPLVGLIEEEFIIKKTHKIAMEGVMDNANTEPGCYCVNKRVAKFKDLQIEYPRFYSDHLADMAVGIVVDTYNKLLWDIQSLGEFSIETLMMQFKCVSVFLFSFLQLHPFGDGNGRLARLLASYSLLTFSPFMTPIYNVFSSSREHDYIEALVTARQFMSTDLVNEIDDEVKAINYAETLMKQKPEDLCAMLIESNWSMWQQFFNEMAEHANESSPAISKL